MDDSHDLRRDSDGIEITQQKITRKLQQIDANFCKAHKVASQMMTEVKQFNLTMRQITAHAQKWKHCLDAFAPRAVPPRAEAVAAADSSDAPEGTATGKDAVPPSAAKSCISSASGLSATPEFKTSFAQGMHGRTSTSSGGDASSIGALEPPATMTPFYKASKTPGLDELSASNIVDDSIDASLADGTPGSAAAVEAAAPSATPAPSAVAATPALDAAAQSSHKRAAGDGDSNDNGEAPPAKRVQRTPAAPRNRTPPSLCESLDSDGSPSFGSPTLTTAKLQALAPKTPISAGLARARSRTGTAASAGRPADMTGSFEEATLIGELEMMENEPPPTFSLDILPPHLRAGEGAVQVTELYNKFETHADAAGLAKPLTMPQLCELMPSVQQERIGLLLEALVSRRLLVPFETADDLYWRRPDY